MSNKFRQLPEQEKIGYSTEEAAYASGFGRTFIYSAIKKGHLTARKYGRRTVILRDDLEAFVRDLPPLTRPAK